MLRATFNRVFDERQKRVIKTTLNGWKVRAVRTLRAYDGRALASCLRRMGIAEGDTLMVHSNFQPDSGFQGSPQDVVRVLRDVVGPSGNLLMVSIPFRGSAYDHLLRNKAFNVRKTISMMGLITEMFRRTPGTLRSLHPTHPVLAAGPDAARLVADHERCLYPCGSGSPFEKLVGLKGKILFYDVGFGAITFFHHVEDVLKDRLPFPVYDGRLFTAEVIDGDGRSGTVQTYAFSRSPARRADKLEAEMRARGRIRGARVGNSHLLLVTAADVVSCQTAMVEAGNLPYGD